MDIETAGTTSPRERRNTEGERGKDDTLPPAATPNIDDRITQITRITDYYNHTFDYSCDLL